MKYTDTTHGHIAEFHDYGICVPSRTVNVELGDDEEVNWHTANGFIKNIHILELLGDKPIKVLINCPGGSVTSGMAIYDALKASKCQTVGYVYGEASSMGSVILQACTRRIAMPSSYFLLHDGETSVSGNLRDVEARVEADRKERLHCYRIYAQRTGKPAKYWYGKLSKDFVLFAEDALKEGIVDEIQK